MHRKVPSKLPKEPTTATTLSKTLVLVLFITLSVTGLLYVYGFKYNHSLMYTSTVSSNNNNLLTNTGELNQTDNTSSLPNTYSNTDYNFSVSYPQGYYIKEITSAYDDTFGLLITNQPNESFPVGLDEENSYILVQVGGAFIKRDDYYWGGYKWVTDVISKLTDENADTNNTVSGDSEDVTKLADFNFNGFTGVKYKAVPKLEGSVSLNYALSTGDRTFLVHARTGNPELIFAQTYQDLTDQIVKTIEIRN